MTVELKIEPHDSKTNDRAKIAESYVGTSMSRIYAAMNLLHCMSAAAASADSDNADERLDEVGEAARGVAALLDTIYIDLEKVRGYCRDCKGKADGQG